MSGVNVAHGAKAASNELAQVGVVCVESETQTSGPPANHSPVRFLFAALSGIFRLTAKPIGEISKKNQIFDLLTIS